MGSRTRYGAFALLSLVLVVAACSGGGNGPTAPQATGALGSASITGSVSTGGSAGAAASVVGASHAGARPRLDADARPGAPSGRPGTGVVTAADETGAGVVVRIQGTSLAATADARGTFRLQGVPQGNQVLLFEQPGSSASLLVEDILPQETIDLDVAVSGSQVQVQSMTRSGGEDETSLDPAALGLVVDPDEWSLEYEHSQGTVEAFLTGEGFELVDLGSIEMEGDDVGALPLPAYSASREGDHVHARFAKNRVLDLLLDPAPGSVHTVLVTFMEEGGAERFELSAQVSIEMDDDGGGDDGGGDDGGGDDGGGDDGGDDGGGDDGGGVVSLTLEMQPDSWNTNWLRSNGTVSALLRGDGFDLVDLGSIVLIGTDPAAGELAPQRADAQGNHVRAYFGQSDAFMTLLDGDTGQTHTITIRFTVDGEEMELTDEIRTVGPAL